MSWTWNWNKMTKEQKQMLGLGAVIVIGTCAGIYLFVMKDFIEKGKTSIEELKNLRSQLRQAELVLVEAPKLDTDLSNLVSRLSIAEEQHIAPAENPLSWVSEKVYRGGREVGVLIDSVAEVSSPVLPGTQAGKPGGERAFRIYTVRIMTACGYRELVNLIAFLEASNPYLCISELSINSQQSTPLKHSISLLVQFPWGSIKDAVDFQRKQAVATEKAVAAAVKAAP
jgi:hypothetical protein